MSDNLFDNFLREKMQNHASPVAEGMWDRISAARQKKRRGIYWWRNRGIGLLVVAVLLSGALYTGYHFSSSNATDAGMETSKVSTAPGNTTPTTANNQPADATGVDDNGSSNTGNKGLASATASTRLDVDNKDFKPTADVADIGVASRKNQTIDNSLANVTPVNKRGRLRSSTSAAGVTSASGPSDRLLAFQQERLRKGKVTKTTRDIVPPSLEDYNANYQKDALKLLAARDLQGVTTNVELRHKVYKLPPITDCPSASERTPANWFAEVFVAPDYTSKKVFNNGINDEYLRRKDSSESYSGAFTAGIRLSRSFGEHLMLKTGLQYSQINEKFSYRSENERRIVTVITIRTIVRNPGDTVTVTDTSRVTQIGYKLKTTQNKYRSLDIPVILGYEWGNENFRASLNGGVIFNVQSWQQGEMLDTTYQPVAFNKAGNTVFKQNVGMSLYGSLALYKRIGERMEAFAEPYFRYGLSNMTNSNSPFSQRLNVMGINLGIRYNINGGRQR